MKQTDNVNVPGEAVQDGPERRRLEEEHGRAQDGVEHAVVHVLGGADDAERVKKDAAVFRC